MGDPFAALDAERRRVDRFYAALPPAGWAEPTRCTGWDRKDLLAHLIGTEEYTASCLDDRVAEHAADVGADYEQANEVVVGRMKDWSPERLLDEWRRRVEKNHRRLRERGVDGKLATSVGPYPLGRQAWYLACELAIHADDAGVPVDPDESADRLRWRREFGLDALAEVAPQVDARAESSEVTVRLDAESATLPDADFVEATSGRLPADHPLPAALRRALTVLA